MAERASLSVSHREKTVTLGQQHSTIASCCPINACFQGGELLDMKRDASQGRAPRGLMVPTSASMGLGTFPSLLA
jgi:hypothetical protein